MFRSILKPEKLYSCIPVFLYSVYAQIREKKQAEKVKETEGDKGNSRGLEKKQKKIEKKQKKIKETEEDWKITEEDLKRNRRRIKKQKMIGTEADYDLKKVTE